MKHCKSQQKNGTLKNGKPYLSMAELHIHRPGSKEKKLLGVPNSGIATKEVSIYTLH